MSNQAAQAMSPETNPLSVYKGADSVKDYLHPGSGPPLPLIEVSRNLNPYYDDGVRIYAKMMTMHPANNVKVMPAANLLETSVVPGKTQTVVEYSSGSTVISMALFGRVFYGLSELNAYVSNKTTRTKMQLLQLFGLKLTLFGGPSQPEPTDERGGIRAAQRRAEESDGAVINPNQYANENNWKSHLIWTGPQIQAQLPEINVICSGMGTSGTITGLGMYFNGADEGDKKPPVHRLGVCTAPRQRVPGPRNKKLLEPVEFPWREVVDEIQEVTERDAYKLSMELTRHGLVCGPSSGLSLQGVYQCIEDRKEAGTLSELAGRDGQINCVFLCCDLPYQYVQEYHDKLDAEHFPSIENKDLLEVDCYRYDEDWEREASEIIGDFFGPSSVRDVLVGELAAPKPGTAIIDLRDSDDAFPEFARHGSYKLPMIKAGDVSPFADPAVLKKVWTELEEKFKNPSKSLKAHLGPEGQKRILVLCYDGDSSRVANSILRQRKYQSFNIRGGVRRLAEEAKKVKTEMEMEMPSHAASQLETQWLELSSDNDMHKAKHGHVEVAVEAL